LAITAKGINDADAVEVGVTLRETGCQVDTFQNDPNPGKLPTGHNIFHLLCRHSVPRGSISDLPNISIGK